MVEQRVYTEIRLQEKRSFRRSQNKRKRTEEEAQKRRDDRAAERQRLAVENPAALAAKRASKKAKHERKLARRAEAAESAATAGASTLVLGETVVADPYDSNIIDYDSGCEGYSDDEDYEYDNGHVKADEGFASQLVPASLGFKRVTSFYEQISRFI
jgi:hypothetical protein